jgi:hypothetical protein
VGEAGEGEEEEGAERDVTVPLKTGDREVREVVLFGR